MSIADALHEHRVPSIALTMQMKRQFQTTTITYILSALCSDVDNDEWQVSDDDDDDGQRPPDELSQYHYFAHLCHSYRPPPIPFPPHNAGLHIRPTSNLYNDIVAQPVQQPGQKSTYEGLQNDNVEWCTCFFTRTGRPNRIPTTSMRNSSCCW